MKGVKITLFLLALILFVSNYKICDYFYYNEEIKDIKLWWGLKSNIYAIIVALLFLGSSLGQKGWIRFILEVGVGFAISNVIDKVWYNVLEFTTSDIYMIIITISVASYNYYKDARRGNK